MKKKLIPIILLAVTIVLVVVSYFILPENVVTQFSIGGTGNTIKPKVVALIIPAVIGLVGFLMSYFSKEDEKAFRKGLIVSVVGIAVVIIMVIVNCVF